MNSKNILITGTPGVGKTTFIQNIIPRLEGVQTVGFFTQEIREKGIRKGFELVRLDGKRRLLSHVNFESPFRIGKYGVDLVGFEKFLDTLMVQNPKAALYVIDEIGKMECFSKKFQTLVTHVLNSEIPVVATVSHKGGGFISAVKARTDVVLKELTSGNGAPMLTEVVRQLWSLLESSPT